MYEIELSKEERTIICRKLKSFMDEELGHDISVFDAEFLLDFFNREIAAPIYNQGLYDAAAILSKQIDSVSDAIMDLEKKTGA